MIEYSKTYSFAGISIKITGDREIRTGDQYISFLSTEEPDINIRLVSSSLPERKGKLVFSRTNHQYYIDGDSHCYYSMYLSKDSKEYIDYACLIKKDNDCTLYIDYPDLWDSMIFEAINISQILIERNTVLLHCSCVEYKGKAILFTAPKQVGKSTQASLWEKYKNTKIINEDRMALRFIEGQLYSCGTPYRGSSDICENKTLPVGIIFAIEQGKDNSISPLSASEAYMKLFEGITCDYQLDWVGERCDKLITEIVSTGLVRSFVCTPDENAVIAAENEFLSLKC